MHMAQLMSLPLTVSCSSKIQISFTFLVPAYPGCPGKEAVKWLLLLLFLGRKISEYTGDSFDSHYFFQRDSVLQLHSLPRDLPG